MSLFLATLGPGTLSLCFMTAYHTDPVEQYLSAARDLLASIGFTQIRSAGVLAATVLGPGGIIHIFGSGYSGLLAQEVFYRGGELVAVNLILDPRLGFGLGALESTAFERGLDAAEELTESAGFEPGDVGIVISNSGRNALPVKIALRMKAAGMAVIVLANLERSRSEPSWQTAGNFRQRKRWPGSCGRSEGANGPLCDADTVLPCGRLLVILFTLPE
ncbi:MAG: SIS domain-containing protein [Acidobacteria bacterium]|nr:MAG: SIS domain-containing protein [Acidobacteriota bacterium]